MKKTQSLPSRNTEANKQINTVSQGKSYWVEKQVAMSLAWWQSEGVTVGGIEAGSESTHGSVQKAVGKAS